MWSRWGEQLAQRMLASAPALWGKLPSHGDYVRYRATAGQAQAWGEWVEQHWAHASLSVRDVNNSASITRRQRRDGPSPWVSTYTTKPKPRLQDLPVAFVLPPGHMAFAKRQFVQGVWVPSQDRSGRTCPLVIYQLVSPHWLRQTTLQDTAPAQQGGHAQHWLYGLTRLGAHVQGGAHDFNRICQALDALWALHRPGWAALCGETPPPAPARERHACLADLASMAEHDAAQDLRGVAQLPWPQWPQPLLHTPGAQAAYWQQDAQGGYVNAGLSLEELWKAHT